MYKQIFLTKDCVVLLNVIYLHCLKFNKLNNLDDEKNFNHHRSVSFYPCLLREG